MYDTSNGSNGAKMDLRVCFEHENKRKTANTDIVDSCRDVLRRERGGEEEKE